MSRDALVIDVALAVAFAAVVLIASPGLAVVALLALLVLLVCGLSLLLDSRRTRKRLRKAAPPRRRAPGR